MCSSISPVDAISELPTNALETILMRLPQKDAVKTSVLSSKWRYKWLTLPQLMFDYPSSYKLEISERNKLKIAVYQALLLHRGPLLKFSLSVSGFENYSDINHWLHFLSKNDIEDLTLRIWSGGPYRLPCHLYSFQKLRRLNLYNCVFKPPSTFKGFDRLVSLEFHKVSFPAERFGIFISNCPLLERMTLEGCPHLFCLRINAPNLKYLSFCGTFDSVNLKNTPLLEVVSITLNGMPETAKYLKDRGTSNLLEIVSSVPSIENLSAELHFFKFLARGSVHTRLPKTLDHLRVLHLSDICFEKLEEVSCALSLIKSSPNLQKLTIRANTKTDAVMGPVLEFIRVQDFSDCSLNQLCEVKVQLMSGVQAELEFIKFLLATSPILEKLEILPATEKSTSSGFRILRELIRFRRASAKAEIVYLDPDR